MREDYLILNDLVKIFGGAKESVVAVDHVSLQVREGELVTLLGPSGCGKTTTLRMIAGFEFPTSGDIYLDGERMNNVPPNRRPTTMVFQNYALFPHMSVSQNIEYGLKIHRVAGRQIKERVEEVMRLVGLKGMGSRSPAKLSGGQQQRVSLARSLIMEPKVLLLDEPLSNLDAKLRESTRIEIRKLQRRVGITSVYVTHDQEEAMTLSDRVMIMHEGRIQQIGTPSEIYAHPANRFVADFIGKANFLDARIESIDSPTSATVDMYGTKLKVSEVTESLAEGMKVVVVVRPESIALQPKTRKGLTGVIQESVYLGSEIVYEVQLQDKLITVKVPNPREHTLFKTDQEVAVLLKEKSLHILPAEEPSG
jgi:iron(III) transport system ATP-binding protein